LASVKGSALLKPVGWEFYCHGLFVLCGETRSQLPRNGLYLRCEMSLRISSGILAVGGRRRPDRDQLDVFDVGFICRCKETGVVEETRSQILASDDGGVLRAFLTRANRFLSIPTIHTSPTSPGSSFLFLENLFFMHHSY
jgi:hypothetical protein